MSSEYRGGCLCGQIRYAVNSEPLRVTICHCRFCQRATGSDRMIQPVFDREALEFSGSIPKLHSQPSDGSGKAINVHFCADCGTKLALTFERWPDKIGLFFGTLDTPAAVAITPRTSKHIFVSEAPAGTILPPGVKTYLRHATENDGTPIEPVIHALPFVVR